MTSETSNATQSSDQKYNTENSLQYMEWWEAKANNAKELLSLEWAMHQYCL